MIWTDELREQCVEFYTEAIEKVEEDKRPEASSEVVADIRKVIIAETGQTPTVNGIVMILSKAGVYVSQSKRKTATGTKGGGRRSKADSHADLTSAIEAFNAEYEQDLIDKLTIKQSDMFTAILLQIQSNL